jgi:hypothetical protein
MSLSIIASASAFELNELISSLNAQKLAIGGRIQSIQKDQLATTNELSSLIKQEYDIKNSLQAIYMRENKGFYCIPGKICIDDRLDYVDAVTIEKQAADSTVLLTRSTNVFKDPPSQAGAPTTYSIRIAANQMCSNDQVDAYNKKYHANLSYPRFRDQPMNAGFCTGFKIAPNLIATAGHCVKSADDCKTIRFIVGYHIQRAGEMPNQQIPASRVYSCNKIVGAGKGGSSSLGNDWVVVEADRPLDNIPAVKLAKPPSIKKADGVTVIGYPMGLPSKIAGDAAVLYAGSSYFESYVDTFGGNSGSPVFETKALNEGQLLVQGMLISGRPDFAITSPCYLPQQYPASSGGEDAAYVAALFDLLPK